MLNIDNLKLVCMNKKETNVELDSTNFSRIFVIKKNIIIIFDDYILVNDEKIEVVVKHITKYKNALIFNDHENIYKLCFNTWEIDRFYVEDLAKGEVLNEFLGCLTKDGIYRLFSDNKNIYELKDIKDFKMKYYVVKDDGKWYDKEKKLEDVYAVMNIEFGSFFILKEKFILNSHSCENELFSGDLGSDNTGNPIFYVCTFEDFILVAANNYSSVCLYSKDLKLIDQSGNSDYIFVKADENDDPIYLRGIDSSENYIVTLDRKGTVTCYRIEGIENKERENAKFTTINSYKISDKSFVACNDKNKEIDDKFNCIMESDDSVLTDNSFTVHDKTKNVKMNVGDIGYDSLGNFDKGNSDEQSEVSSSTTSSPEYSQNNSKILEKRIRTESFKDKEEFSVDISKLFTPQSSDNNNFNVTKETKIQKPTVSFSKGFLNRDSIDTQESTKNPSMANISGDKNLTSKDDGSNASKFNLQISEPSLKDFKNFMDETKSLSKSRVDEQTNIIEGDRDSTFTLKSNCVNSSNEDIEYKGTTDKNNLKNKLLNISKGLEKNLDDIINQINSIQVNNDGINNYKLNSSKIPKLYDELYQNIMRLENVNSIKQNIESNLLTMINSLDLRSSLDILRIKNSINYFNEVIERKTTGNKIGPMFYDEPIVDDIEFSISNLKIDNKIEENKDYNTLSKIYLEPVCSLSRNISFDRSNISFISLENETKCDNVECKEKSKYSDEVEENISNSVLNTNYKDKGVNIQNEKGRGNSNIIYFSQSNTDAENGRAQVNNIKLNLENVTTHFNNTNMPLESPKEVSENSEQSVFQNAPSMPKANIFDKISKSQNEKSSNTPFMSSIFQGSNLFNGVVSSQKDLNQSSSEVFSRIVNSGASIPVINKTEPQTDDSKPPSAFSKFARNHTLFK